MKSPKKTYKCVFTSFCVSIYQVTIWPFLQWFGMWIFDMFFFTSKRFLQKTEIVFNVLASNFGHKKLKVLRCDKLSSPNIIFLMEIFQFYRILWFGAQHDAWNPLQLGAKWQSINLNYLFHSFEILKTCSNLMVAWHFTVAKNC